MYKFTISFLMLLLVNVPAVWAAELGSQKQPVVLAANPFSFLFGSDNKNKKNNYQRQSRYARDNQRPYQYNYYPKNRYQNNFQQQRKYDDNYRYQTQRRYWRGTGWYTEPGTQRGDYSDDRDHTRDTRNSTVRYSTKICDMGEYKCIKIKSGQTWEKLFPDEKERDLVRRFNRTNMRLSVGQQIAIPNDLETATLLTISPFDEEIEANDQKTIIVDLPKQAFGAYNGEGKLVHWGPVSGGQNWCGDIGQPCTTIRGVFNVFEKRDASCKSRSFPVDRGGGSPMPYCMFFHSGFALHGSYEVPGYNASHGCVRMYTEDAKWLNENFVEVPEYENDKGTRVIVLTSDEETRNAQVINKDSVEDEWDYRDDYYDL